MSPEPQRIAVFGGIYSNHLALGAAIEDARARGAEALYCLGDLGAFGPHPDRVFPLLVDAGVRVLRGNYDDSIARGLDDCQCGYTDPRDNHFARLSYRYTFRNTAETWRRWLGRLPGEIRLQVNGTRVLMCHGSPRRINEFLWESATSTQFLAHLAREHETDVVLATHTGIPWRRALPGGGQFINVGVLGRPANDGRTEVWYALLDFGGAEDGAGGGAERGSPAVEFVPVAYDHERLAHEMRGEGLPEEFVQTILTGWWTTCLEVLPARERARGRY
ncbi:metallophosphoesterase family protein [Candidatus Palauibacter sp.]|uniref:metallophosphoesterase family protein n=1 Tax=Candidatus Palauibacter sp. TaxID=3101350 RepID=UPI003B026739